MNPAIRDLLENAFTGGASDVFMIEGERPRVRKDGEVIIAHGGPVSKEDVAAIWRECGCDPDSTNDGDSSLAVEGAGRLRANVYRSLGRLGVVLRPIKKEIPGFDELGVPGELLASWMQRRSGLVIVCGPTGSGKSTTIAACLQWINQNQMRHIVTIEDPIEYLFENEHSWFSQREVRRDTENFNVALRAALRQNPDVILFGEIRDAESAFTALRAAETGHLVISTLHGSGVAGVATALDRLNRILSDSGSAGAASLLSHQLIGVIAQQLLPRINGGVVAVLEYFENSGAARKWIEEGRYDDIKDFLNKSDEATACSFLRYLIAATQQGIIDPAVARTATDRPQDFDRAMRGIS
ncbi:ATPase, T2SS/T4P/T4SS family [Haloferula sp. BvORR071]|uniref:type IV pilus twitching motility protein PilT n=1 Tax=Haloferula sp. BvORR071 TaxID=1396141 RepID=UPI0006980596|nr:ATPase, T2SS/T4P/T4SS family [Haloferula sp. BvORR071]